MMSDRHADQGHRKFWSTMKELSWKERVQHFIFYYGKYTIIGLLLIYMLTSVLYDAYKEKPEVILSGTAINVSVSVDMEKRLKDDVFSYVGGSDTAKQTIKLVPNEVSSTSLITSVLQAKLWSGDYHYLLADQEGLDVVLNMQALPNLKLVISEEKLELLKDRLIMVQSEGETFPVAINITDTVLAAGCTFEGDRIYLSFPVTTETLAVVEPFLDYLLGQGLLNTP